MNPLALIAQAATQPAPVGETPWERVALAVVSAVVVIALAWIAKVSTKATEAKTTSEANTERINQHSDRLYNMALDSTPTPPPVTGTGPGGKPGDAGGGTGSRVPRTPPQPLPMSTGAATFVTGNPATAQMTNWIPTEPKP